MTPPATAVRERVKTLADAEFAAEGWETADDKLLRASGRDGVTRLAVYPDDEHVLPRNQLILLVPVTFQLYLGYDDSIDEHMQVDPGIIEELADRFRRAFEDNSSGTTDDLWYLTLDRIEYPDDPTGNKTRFEATIVGRCDNPPAR